MKSLLLYAAALVLMFTACNNDDRNLSAEPQNEMDAVRNFIRAALDGDYKKAKTMVFQDSINLQVFEGYQRSYEERMSKEEKNNYRAASIRIHHSSKINDSTSLVVYSNSYRNQKDTLKLIKIGGKWLVDFAHNYKNKPDTLK
jgi:hypothetical protein